MGSGNCCWWVLVLRHDGLYFVQDSLVVLSLASHAVQFLLVCTSTGCALLCMECKACSQIASSQTAVETQVSISTDSALLCHQVLTDGGLLAALHNGDGHVMWSHHYGPDAAPTLLLPWRSSHDVQHAPEVKLLCQPVVILFMCWPTVVAHAVHTKQMDLSGSVLGSRGSRRQSHVTHVL